MSKSHGFIGFVAGVFVGAIVGATAGLMIAPRSGEETRTKIGQSATDAWDSVVDAYHEGAKAVSSSFEDVRPTVDAKSDELREKVDQARARMDSIRSSLSESVNQAAGWARTTVSEAVDAATDGHVADDGTAYDESWGSESEPSATSATAATPASGSDDSTRL